MPAVTALRAAGPGRLRIDVDGEPWRTVPAEAAARAGLARGVELDRPRLRSLARELRRSRAVDVATRALARRDFSERGLRERIRRAGVAAAAEEEAVAALSRAGLVDDGRFAAGRAEALARRGFGDQAIRFDLECQRVEAPAIEAALLALEPESDRARTIAARRGPGQATARYLARRGFEEESIEAAAVVPVAPDA